MSDLKQFVESKRLAAKDNYLVLLSQVQRVMEEYSGKCANCDPTGTFILDCANLILTLGAIEDTLTHDYYMQESLESISQKSGFFFREVMPENYATSYANPAYAVQVFGNEKGQLLSFLYVMLRQMHTNVYQKAYHKIVKQLKVFLDAVEIIKKENWDYEQARNVIIAINVEDLENTFAENIWMRFGADFDFYKNIAETSDLSDLRYLYRYGVYITENEIKMAKFMASYPAEKLENLAKVIVQAFVDGFVGGNRNLASKKTVTLMMSVGQERLMRLVMKGLRERNLEPLMSIVQSSPVNKQYTYDHRFDTALYYTEEFANTFLKDYKHALERTKELLSATAGPIYVETFGEIPFSPENKKECLTLSEEQLKLNRETNNKMNQAFYSYYKRDEASFSIISFPSPEIGENFEELFAETVKINTLDSKLYASIQQKIIEGLDQAEYVHVKGKAGNETDIMVKMHEIKDPAHETNFENCVADVNVPVGEVFTSPLLTGTNGVLHVEDTYLHGLRYNNVKLTFKDGMVVDYSCKNFDNEADSRKFIEENLLFPHKTLPIGEFAIGTNTLAYVFAKKYNIMHLLPILITEKMGPHFAVGDTCFSWEEDSDHIDHLTGKKLIAVENEKTRLRKTNPMQAYTQCHTDITLPYEGLDTISAIRKDGTRIDVIRDGRFCIPGTEELNKAFE
ncbi:MAG TPA: aminopeptidase [Candidatus Cloacimonadota bacterium]|nr:aminopeptidase [Candidatus Cloacimonadota bacterium]